MGKAILFCGPSGVGKSFAIRALVATEPDLFAFIPSIMTRPRRPSDNDTECTFLDDAAFDLAVQNGTVVPSATLRGYRYGLDLRDFSREGKPHGCIPMLASGLALLRSIPSVAPHLFVLELRTSPDVLEKNLVRRGVTGEALTRELVVAEMFERPPNPNAVLTMQGELSDVENIREVLINAIGQP